ncbi:MAG TPA: hypothetical protein VFZ53_02110 [Polyangiaceae bacterium]
MVKRALGWIVAACVCMPACAGDEEPADATAALEIEGEWESNFMSTEVISAESWRIDSSFPSSSEILEFSNDENAAVLLAEDGTYERKVWTEVEDDSFYYCTVAFGKTTADEAVTQSEPADATDPANGGCGMGDFGWTMLTRK